MKSFLLILVNALILVYTGRAQIQENDSLRQYSSNAVVVTSFKEEEVKLSTLNISALNVDSLSATGNFSLTDLLQTEPGIEALSSGNGISKPVIRGLSGNRVLVLMSGLKFDNQQWQEEHGLGLSDIGLSSVEVIKGPMSILYGSEAVGGIINLIEEKKPEINTNVLDFGCDLFSNTLGFKSQVGFKTNKGNNWWKLRIGIENHGDYSDGNNSRVLNSRFDGYYFKGAYGFKKDNWISENNFLSSFNRFGFIFNDIYDYISPDKRWSRTLNDFPTHLVLLNIASSQNKVFFDNKSVLHLNIGFQSNERMENEGSGKISLNMHLITGQYLIKWEKPVKDKHRIILSGLGSVENNTNYGIRKIVPDAILQEANFSFYAESVFEKLTIENGVGVGERIVKTKLTASINDNPELKEVVPFTKFSWYYNLFSGLSYFPAKSSYFKLNLSTGVRIPNLAELSADGLHEGVYSYEIGDQNLKNEQSFAANLLFNLGNDKVTFSLSPFYNYFLNYVYLSPTTEQWFGFPIYRFMQQDARQYGFESGLKVNFDFGLTAEIQYAGMESKTADGNFTPFIPAQKLSPKLKYVFHSKKNITLGIYAEADYYMDQYHTAPHEVGTPEYFLFNSGVSLDLKKGRNRLNIYFHAKNLLNQAYYSNLSRFKSLGLFNMGRNFVLGFRYNINNDNK